MVTIFLQIGLAVLGFLSGWLMGRAEVERRLYGEEQQRAIRAWAKGHADEVIARLEAIWGKP